MTSAARANNDLTALVATAWRLDRGGVVRQLALLTGSSLANGFSLLLLVPIINSIADPSATVTVPGLGSISLGSVPLPLLLAAFVACAGGQAALRRASAINAVRLQQQLVDQMRREAFDALLEAQWSWVLQRRRSDIIETVTSGAARCGMALQQLLTSAVTASIAVVTAAVALLVAPAVAAVAIVGVLLLGAALSTSVRPAHRLGRRFSTENRRLQAVMTDSMDSLRMVRAHDATAAWRRQLDEAFSATRALQVANVRRSSTVSALSSTGLAVCASLLVLLAVWAAVPPASLVVVLVVIARLAGNVQSLAQSSGQLANALPAVGDLQRLTADARAHRESGSGEGHPGARAAVASGGGVSGDSVGRAPVRAGGTASGGASDGGGSGAAAARVRGGAAPAGGAGASDAAGAAEGVGAGSDELGTSGPLVELVDVTYRYPGSDSGVTGVDLTIPRGGITVLTGASGAGKSTCADLVLGLLEPDQGQVLVDGRPLRRDELGWWRSHVAYVPQETVLLPGTLRDNLTWSLPDRVSDEACMQALRRSAATFALDLPEGLDTTLGDRGLRLSGGERQRIAIARALLRRPALLVLDEATSALDDATEARVIELVEALVPAVTVLVIAHRRSTIECGHTIVRLAAGGVVSQTVGPARSDGPPQNVTAASSAARPIETVDLRDPLATPGP